MLRGAPPALVRDALARRDPLPGTAGFAGELPPDSDPNANDSGSEALLVRDVLGREPLFREAGEPGIWSFDRRDLDEPVALPAGRVQSESDGERAVWSLPAPPADPPADAAAAVREAVVGRVRALDPNGLAVAFSGGVDSAAVAAGVPDAPCYVAGFPESHDVSAAREAAAAMDRDLRVVELTHDGLRRAVPELVAATGRTNPMDLGIALPLYLVAEAAAADGHDRLALGQGADELFGGYAKVVNPADDHRVAADTVRGAVREVIATLPDQLERDVLALRAAGVEPATPLLADEVVESALRLPDELLVDGDERKVALRAAARELVPPAVAGADKKAVQYGTYAARELDRLARRAGFKRRMDDHLEKYVRSLVED